MKKTITTRKILLTSRVTISKKLNSSDKKEQRIATSGFMGSHREVKLSGIPMIEIVYDKVFGALFSPSGYTYGAKWIDVKGSIYVNTNCVKSVEIIEE